LSYICTRVSKKFKYGTYIKTGKNFSGKICVFHRGGGNKKIYRCIDFYRRLNFFGVVYSVQYDPYRSAYIGLVLYDNGLFSSIVLSDGIFIGSKIFSGKEIISKNCLSKGSSLLLSNLGLFSIISNIESRPLFGASLARAAGSGAITLSFVDKFVNIKLKSG
jgi:large subunit ribosomal protein L2